MAVQWWQILAEALEDADIVAVNAVVRQHLNRQPTRAEITAARRAAHRYADRGYLALVHVPVKSAVGAHRVLLVARPDADLSDEEQLHDIATGRNQPLPRRGAPRSELQVLDTLTRHVCAAATAGRRVDVSRLDPGDAQAFASDLTAALRDLERLRTRLTRRARFDAGR